METEGWNKRNAFNIAHIHLKWRQMTHWVHSRRPLSTQRDYTSLFIQLQHEMDWLMLQDPPNTKLHRIDWCQFCIIHTIPNMMFSATIFICCVLVFLCIHRKYKGNMYMWWLGLTTHTKHTHLFDTAGVLLHGNLFHSALKAEEGLDVQAGGLLKTRPLVILWVNLYTQTCTVYYTVYTCRNKMTRLLW